MYLPIRFNFLSLPSAFSYPKLLRTVREQLADEHNLQQLCEQSAHLTSLELVAAVLAHLAIRVEFEAAELHHLPTADAFLAVANRPGNLLDSLVLLHVLGQARPELKAVVDEALAPLLPQLTTHFLVMAPASSRAGRRGPGLRHLLRLLHNDVPLALFPASRAPRPTNLPDLAARLLTTLHLPVVPVWLSSHPGATRTWSGFLHLLRPGPAGLPRQLLSQRGTTVQVRIGKGVAAPGLPGWPLAARLHARLRALGSASTGDAGKVTASFSASPLAVDAALLEADLAALPPRHQLVQCRQWEVYVAKSSEIPHVLPAIHRLRASLALRASDTAAGCDQYPADGCYRHLFLYDRRARRLVAACQLGLGKKILRQHGRRGFHLHTLFKLNRELRPLLRQSLELSQAVIGADYRGQLLPLGLVWEGLAQYVYQRPQYRYLLGSVSLSQRFFPAPKAVLVDFIKQHCFATELAAYVRPRKAVRYCALDYPHALSTDLDPEQVLQDLVAGLEPGGMGVPVRLRPYFRQQARFIGVNLDPAGSNTLHGALLLDTSNLADYTYRLAHQRPAP